MTSIASVYVDVLPSTAKLAAGIEKALRDRRARYRPHGSDDEPPRQLPPG